jgi:hypothetical protein
MGEDDEKTSYDRENDGGRVLTTANFHKKFTSFA